MKKFDLIRSALFCLIVSSVISCRDRVSPDKSGLPDLETCQSVTSKSRLTYNAQQKGYKYTTSGGNTITISGTTVTLTYKESPSVEFWADEGVAFHENLNGKHIKDWLGSTRSFIFPDGCKLTYAMKIGDLSMVSISIFDGDEVHFFNARCGNSVEGKNTLIYSDVNKEVAKWIDNAQPDGETATLRVTDTGKLYLNIYTEDEPGKKVEKEVPLGSTSDANPKQVNDLYDDPRLAHT